MKTKKVVGYDVIDNACHKLLEEIAGKDLKWNAEAWGEVRDAVESVLFTVYDIKLEFVDDSVCAKAEAGQTVYVAVGVGDETPRKILRQDEFGNRI